MTMTQVRYPIAPAPARRRSTLLDVARRADDAFTWQDGNDLFESYNCLTFGAAAEFCAPNSKTLDSTPSWVDGIRFAAYGGLGCRAVGLDLPTARDQISKVFDVGESTAVERALMETRFIADPGGSPRWGAATDLTPASGAVSPKAGVALLESHAASVYAGSPVLHLPVFIGSYLANESGLVEDGDVLRTRLGSKVAVGAGYDNPNSGPTGAAPAAGERWAYVSGEVVVAAGPKEVRDAYDYENNDAFVLAERPYVVAVDCFAAAVRITV